MTADGIVENMQEENDVSEQRTQTDSQRSGSKPPPDFSGRLKSSEAKFVCCYCHKLLVRPNPIYPHLNASICQPCAQLNPALRIDESDVGNKRSAPWSNEEVDSLNAYQISDLLPYICLKGHVLKADQTGFNCRFCARYSLTWAYDWTLRYGWT